MIPIEIVYDIRARDGTWCTLSYPNHSKGCPKFPKCPSGRPDFRDLNYNEWFAIIVEFDLGRYVELRRLKHPGQSERQLRNLLYWQGKVRAGLRKAILYQTDHNLLGENKDIILDIPEACGINVFETLAKVGILLDRNPQKIVYKTMFIGRYK